MIYIAYGNDIKNKNDYAKKHSGSDSIKLLAGMASRDIIFSCATQKALFGDLPAIILENTLLGSDIVFDKEFLEILKDSETPFIFLEESLSAAEIKNYKKFAEDISEFELPKEKEKINPFILANSFGAKKKIDAWTLYMKAVGRGDAPEAISGMLFWKIKTMLLEGSPIFKKNELKKMSADLVDLYHNAHAGKIDFQIGLEQFILNSLS